MSAARGFTLAEALVALVIAAVLLLALYATLLAGTRLARVESSALEVRRSARAVAAVLRAELQGASAAAGDLMALSDSALVLRAQRGFGVVCAPPGSSHVVLDDSTLSLLRAPDPTRDSVLIFADGDPLSTQDDRWLHAAVTAVRRGACLAGPPGTLLALAGGTVAADIAAVGLGAPVRIVEVQEYRRYVDATGATMFGVRGPAPGGGWAASSPIAGPLQRGVGLVFSYRDASGAAAAAPDDVAVVQVAVRSTAPAPAAPGVLRTDSLLAAIAVGGP